MRSKPVQWVILAAIVAAAVYVVFAQLTDHSAAIKPGGRAPDFTLNRLDGGTVALADLRGKGVILNFWGTYCGPCREEMPALEDAYQRHKGEGLEILGINTGEKSRITIEAFVRQVGVHFPILLDGGLDVVHTYKVGPLPESVFIDSKGEIRAIHTGQMNKAEIESNVRLILP